jgi:hypothetical protein
MKSPLVFHLLSIRSMFFRFHVARPRDTPEILAYGVGSRLQGTAGQRLLKPYSGNLRDCKYNNAKDFYT